MRVMRAQIWDVRTGHGARADDGKGAGRGDGWREGEGI